MYNIYFLYIYWFVGLGDEILVFTIVYLAEFLEVILTKSFGETLNIKVKPLFARRFCYQATIRNILPFLIEQMYQMFIF